MFMPKFRLKLIISVIILTLTSITSSFATNYESLTTIKQTVQQFAKQHVNTSKDERLQVQIGHLDSRLHLSKCDIPLEAFLPNTSTNRANIIVGLRCEGIRPWKIYVPIRLNVYKHVVVADRTLSRGTRLSMDDIKLAEANIAGINHGFYTKKNDVIGKELIRSIATGIPLTANYLKNPMVMKRGQSVTILAKNSSLQVSMRGTALNKGREGDMIRVRNNKSKRIIDAIIINTNTVEVPLA